MALSHWRSTSISAPRHALHPAETKPRRFEDSDEQSSQKPASRNSFCCSSAEAGKEAMKLGIDVPLTWEKCAGLCAGLAGQNDCHIRDFILPWETQKNRDLPERFVRKEIKETPNNPLFKNDLGELMM